MKHLLFAFLSVMLLFFSCKQSESVSVDGKLRPADFSEVRVGGELQIRLHRNFDRMEEEKYHPDKIFLTNEESSWWPGDTEGRTILALVLEAQATGREPKYLNEILARIPEKVNQRGYFGDMQPDSLVDEQQLSSHGWFFRALNEYYLWKKDEKILAILNTMLDSLAIPTKGFHENYPIDPAKRDHAGEHAGNRIEKHMNGWILSTDIGCDFIFLDGLIQAYEITGRKDLLPIIDEIVELYKKVDVEAIKAQTHATLTGVRAMLRYYDVTGNEELLQLAKDRYKTYKTSGMTENYENYNWFGRPQWTEPCAVVDSYMSAVQLWEKTGNPEYLNDAQKIYYNGICFAQRANGGFGTQKCSGANGLRDVTVDNQESHWCCSMRGGEGLARAAQYAAFVKGNSILFTNLVAGDYSIRLGKQTAVFTLSTDYPFDNKATLVFDDNVKDVQLSFFVPEWTSHQQLMLNGAALESSFANGFITVKGSFFKGDKLDITFDQIAKALPSENHLSMQGVHKYIYGPLLLGVKDGDIKYLPADALIDKSGRNSFKVGDQPMTTVYHLMDTSVVMYPKAYRIQILFDDAE
ncbi:MAG: glycoside hydrolase family 127 protein [Bacteroidales bacterium]|nr:glycoside hydrolase family 127 protein [Bacteroidales bacterium]